MKIVIKKLVEVPPNKICLFDRGKGKVSAQWCDNLYYSYGNPWTDYKSVFSCTLFNESLSVNNKDIPIKCKSCKKAEVA